MRHEGRQQGGELVGGGGGAGFVEVDELIGFEAEDLAEVGAVAPGPDEVADPGEGVAALLEPADERESGQVRAPGRCRRGRGVRGRGAGPCVWYSRIVRTGSPARAASSSTVSSTPSLGGVIVAGISMG